jgi:hypothetical protein
VRTPAAPRRKATLTALAAACCGIGLVACDDDADKQGRTAPAAPAAQLRVTVHPNGPGRPARTRRIVCRHLGPKAGTDVCKRLDVAAVKGLAPVPGNVACAELYGGPAVASVSGTLLGERVRLSFDLTNSCEIDRWRRNEALLGAPPRDLPG